MLYRLRAITAVPAFSQLLPRYLKKTVCKQIIPLNEQLSSKYQCGFFIAFSVQHCVLRTPSHELSNEN